MKFTTVEYGSDTYWLSLIKWGFIRKILCVMFRASPFPFTPSYELAIFDGDEALKIIKKKYGNLAPSYRFVNDPMLLYRYYDNPMLLYHFKDKELALERLALISRLLEEGGIRKLISTSLIPDPQREGVYIDYYEYVEKKPFL